MSVKVLRRFVTVATVENVRVRVPKVFKTDHFLPIRLVVRDGESVIDEPHYYDGVPLKGRLLNRHYYFPRPQEVSGRKSVVARVCVVTELLPDGREFTRLDLYPYPEIRAAEFELKFSENGQVGLPILGGPEKIIFWKIKLDVAELTECVNDVIRQLAEKKAVIPHDSNRSGYTRACWALSQIKRLKLGASNKFWARFENDLTKTLPLIRAKASAQ